MGKKILKKRFDKFDYEEFIHRVKQETQILEKWCQLGLLSSQQVESGFELEMWLLNENYEPARNNLIYLENLNRHYLVSEAAKCCIEANIPYDSLHNHALERHQKNITDILKECFSEAQKKRQQLIAIGTLPHVSHTFFSEEMLTEENRYYAIHERLIHLRKHQPTKIDIQGHDRLEVDVSSFALMGAISSFQIHFRVSFEQSARLYNAALILSAPMIAMSANSPYLFGYDLWQESRIPFYEQFLKKGHYRDLEPRVTFGHGYATHSLLDIFKENSDLYAPLLPQVMEEIPENMSHLKLHNGNIYRWNRPVIDFDKDKKPHFRIEHRILPSGPSVIDMISNAAFFFGITYFHTLSKSPLEQDLLFMEAKGNFYRAAQFGLETELNWVGKRKLRASELILTELLPQAKEGLIMLDLDKDNIDYYLSVIEARVKRTLTGSAWQREFLKNNDHDFHTLLSTYIELQQSGKALHEWPTK